MAEINLTGKESWEGRVEQPAVSRLREATEVGIDVFLSPEIGRLKESYRAYGDPHIVFLAASGIVQLLKDVPSAERSFQFARLLALVSEMLIAQGRDILTLTTALDTVEKALSILDKVPVRDEEIAKAYVEFTLYRAIALKALGEFDEALGEVRSTAQRLRFQQEMSYLELIMLHRQEVMMLQDAKQYQKLAENSQQYANAKPVEYYGTIKRVFEFAMNRDLPDAAKIFPEFRRSYGAARQKLPLLSHVSFTKNVGQFLGQHGRPAAALKVLDAAKSAADRLNLYGQKRQIDALMDDVRQNTKNGLKTFSVGR